METNENKSERLCLHCHKPFNPVRITKRYCSDRCRYLAFLKKPEVEQSIENKPEMTDEVIVPTVNSNVSAEKNDKNKTPNDKRKEMKTLNANRENEFFPTISGTEHSYSPTNEVKGIEPLNPELTRDKTVNANEKNDNNLQKTVNSTKPLQSDPGKTAENKNKDNGDLSSLNFLRFYWSGSTLTDIEWVTIRYRCLLITILDLENSRFIKSEIIKQMAKVLQKIIVSNQFQRLPFNYPYTNKIKEMQKKMSRYACKPMNRKIKFTLSKELSDEMLTTLIEIGDFVPDVEFDELRFEK